MYASLRANFESCQSVVVQVILLQHDDADHICRCRVDSAITHNCTKSHTLEAFSCDQLSGCTAQHEATTLITVYLGHYVLYEGNCSGSGCSGEIRDMNVGHYSHFYLFVQLLRRFPLPLHSLC